MNIRKVIRSILSENRKPAILDSSISEIQALIKNASTETQIFGYNVLDVVLENETTADIVFTISLQHVKPNFGKYIDELIAKGGKFARIYGDTPTSKTKITRWLTGFKEGADIDARQKSAAIKVAQLAGLDCINDAIISEIERDYACTCVANFTGAKTNKKGQSFFELFIFDTGDGIQGQEQAVVNPPPQPTEIPVDDEIIEIEPEKIVTPQPVAKKKKPRKSRAPKLNSKQRKAGYNRINQAGDIRHVLEPDELEDIADHIVDLVLDGGGTEKELLPEPMETYERLKNLSKLGGAKGKSYFRIVDDYFDDDAPILKMYKGFVVHGGEIKSRSMMQQYTSKGSNLVKGMILDDDGEYLPGMEVDPNFGRDENFGIYTPPKLGGKEAKDARRYAQQTRSGDELIIYATIEPKKNRFNGKISKHTGKVTLYVFLLDRNFA